MIIGFCFCFFFLLKIKHYFTTFYGFKYKNWDDNVLESIKNRNRGGNSSQISISTSPANLETCACGLAKFCAPVYICRYSSPHPSPSFKKKEKCGDYTSLLTCVQRTKNLCPFFKKIVSVPLSYNSLHSFYPCPTGSPHLNQRQYYNTRILE